MENFTFPKKKSDCEETACFNPDPLNTFQKHNREFDIFAEKNDCPLNRAELGNSTWKILHTMAAYYPEKPTSEDKFDMEGIFKGLQKFYPCKICASDLKEQMEKSKLESENSPNPFREHSSIFRMDV